MTFLVAWKLRDVVYICADSAVTSGNKRVPCDRTSFGELHVNSQTKLVEEAALKIIEFGNVVVAIAGSVEPAMDFISTFKNDCKSTRDSYESFRRTVNSYTPLDVNVSFKLILAIADSSGPRLITFNLDNTGGIMEHGYGLVYTGSMPYQHTEIIVEQIRLIMLSDIKDPQSLLVSALAFLQNVGIYDYLLKYGVGGIFTGVYVNSSSIHWQPRLAYGIAHDDELIRYVFSGFINTALVVFVQKDELNRVFYRNNNGVAGESWKNKTMKKARSVFRSGRFDFVVLFGTNQKSIVVLEMKKELVAKSCVITPAKDNSDLDDNMVLNIGVTDLVTGLLSGKKRRESHRIVDTDFYFLDFQKRYL